MSWWTPLPSVGVTVATIVLALVALVYLMHNMDSVDYLNYYEYDSVIEDWLDDNIASVAVTYLFNVLFQISSLVASIMALIIFFRGQGYYAEKPKRQKIFLWVSVGSAVILALTVSSVFLWLNEAVTTCFPAVV
jgi:magnesium-transporting ATPase (P-type)